MRPRPPLYSRRIRCPRATSSTACARSARTSATLVAARRHRGRDAGRGAVRARAPASPSTSLRARARASASPCAGASRCTTFVVAMVPFVARAGARHGGHSTTSTCRSSCVFLCYSVAANSRRPLVLDRAADRLRARAARGGRRRLRRARSPPTSSGSGWSSSPRRWSPGGSSATARSSSARCARRPSGSSASASRRPSGRWPTSARGSPATCTTSSPTR